MKPKKKSVKVKKLVASVAYFRPAAKKEWNGIYTATEGGWVDGVRMRKGTKVLVTGMDKKKNTRQTSSPWLSPKKHPPIIKGSFLSEEVLLAMGHKNPGTGRIKLATPEFALGIWSNDSNGWMIFHADDYHPADVVGWMPIPEFTLK